MATPTATATATETAQSQIHFRGHDMTRIRIIINDLAQKLTSDGCLPPDPATLLPLRSPSLPPSQFPVRALEVTRQTSDGRLKVMVANCKVNGVWLLQQRDGAQRMLLLLLLLPTGLATCHMLYAACCMLHAACAALAKIELNFAQMQFIENCCHLFLR